MMDGRYGEAEILHSMLLMLLKMMKKVRMVMNHDADANAQDKGTDAAAREVEAERSKILGHQRFNVRWEYLFSQLSTKMNYFDIEERFQERILSWTRCCRCRWERWERRCKKLQQTWFRPGYTYIWQNNTIILAVLAVKGNWLKIWQTCGRPRVFGGDLDDYFEATGEMIPAVVQSCVDTIRRLFLVASICFFVFCIMSENFTRLMYSFDGLLFND